MTRDELINAIEKRFGTKLRPQLRDLQEVRAIDDEVYMDKVDYDKLEACYNTIMQDVQTVIDETLRAAEACVPKRAHRGRDTSPRGADMWDACRTQTLANLKALQDNPPHGA